MSNDSGPVAVNDETFDSEVVENDGRAMVDFWAEWCGPCRIVEPVVEELAQEYAGQMKVAKVNVDEAQETAQRFNVRSIPSILFFVDGELVDTVVGAQPKKQLEKRIQEHL